MREIVINKNEKQLDIILLENGNVIEKYKENNAQNRIEGNIYLGKVQNVLPGMQAAFVDIGEEKNTFIHLKDVLPKVDETKHDVKDILKEKNIKEIVKPGMKIIVQVKRDATNKKGARVSTHISLPSRFAVLMPNADFITISQKIEDEKEKLRLTKIVKETLPNGYGAIIRTAAYKKQDEQIKEDLIKTVEKWKTIKKDAEKIQEENKPQILYESLDLIQKFLLDVLDQQIEKITVNDKQILNKVEKFTKEVIDKKINIECIENTNLLSMYDIDKQLEKIANRKVWLKCGGFITIDYTEALTAIDVNSGKYVGTKDLEQTVFTVNKEASIEIAKQLRLRDIGGMIIIDYIDMQKKENKQKIVEILEENLKKDRSKTQVIGFTKLNLLEMTRKHMFSND